MTPRGQGLRTISFGGIVPAKPPMIELSLYANAFARTPAQIIVTEWRDLAADIGQLLELRAAEKTALPALAPHALRDGATRSLAGVDRVTALMIDVDTVPGNDLGALLDRILPPAIVYASPSDAPERRRVRVLAPLRRPVSPMVSAHLRCAYAESLGLAPGCGVEGALDCAHLFFVGALDGTPAREWWVVD